MVKREGARNVGALQTSDAVNSSENVTGLWDGNSRTVQETDSSQGVTAAMGRLSPLFMTVKCKLQAVQIFKKKMHL